MDPTAEITRDVEAWLRRHEHKEMVRFVAVGSVDDGKSTLIGRLLHDTQGVYEDQLAAVKRASARGAVPEGEIDFSLFTDGLKAEREQGITIDVAYRYFATETRKFILADTPGHVQYTRNMATGASTADVAIVLLDARLGVLSQSRRHAYIASLLGIPQLVVAVNKMDLVGYDQAVFERLRQDFGAYVAPLGFRGVTYLPISAVKGDNVVAHSPRTPWYTGPTVLQHLEAVPVARNLDAEALRFPVQYVLRPHLDYRGFAGQIAGGSVRPGDRVTVLPSRRTARVKAVDTWEGEVPVAFAPMSVTLRLDDEVDISRGDMLALEGQLPRVTQRFDAMLVWMSERVMDPHRAYLVKHTTRVVPAQIARVASRTDPETLAPVPADTLGLNDIGRVTVQCNRPLFVDPYRVNRATGAFVVIDALTNDTVAAGMVLEAGDGTPTETLHAPRVSAAERRARLGQSGAVVWIEAPPGADAMPLARALERVLFDQGRVATAVAGAATLVAETAQRCADAGLVVICAMAGVAPEARDAVRDHVGATAFVAVRGAAVPTVEGTVSLAPEGVDAVAVTLADVLTARGVFAAAG